MEPRPLPCEFYERDTIQVARELLGSRLIRVEEGNTLSGTIIETEAYLGFDDSASHAYRGKTPRNAVLFGPAGYSYIYFVYGLHYLLNVSAAPDGVPHAVLIRAIVPIEGMDVMQAHRGTVRKLTDGPAKVCQALGISRTLNGWDLTLGMELWIEKDLTIPADQILVGPRIGIDYALPQ